MSSVGMDSFPRAPDSPSRLIAWWDLWRAIPLEEWIGAAMLGMAVASVSVVQRAVAPSGFDWLTCLILLLGAEVHAVLLLLAVNVANRAVDGGAPRLRTYAAAVLLAAVAGACVWGVMRLLPGWPTDAVTRERQMLNPWLPYTSMVYMAIEWILYGGLAAYVYLDRREARRMIARVHEAGVRHATEAKAMYESELQTLQARVEPAFLSGTLGRIRDLYERDAGTAGAVLDELIVYLRAAMPHIRQTAAPLAQELELVRSWVAIMDSARLLAVTIGCPPGAASARIPSMLLLPLVQATCEGEMGQHANGAALRVDATQAGDRLDIEVMLDASAGGRTPGAPDVGELRQRLAALFGAGAALEATASDGRVQAVLRIPYETFADIER